MSIYKAFENIGMIVLNILGYFGRNKQNSYAALNSVLILKLGQVVFSAMRRIATGSGFEPPPPISKASSANPPTPRP